MRRREALVLGSAVAVALAIPPVLRRMPSRFDFQSIAGEDGFRRLMGGSISGSVDPFFGIDPDVSNNLRHEKPLCTALFGTEKWSADAVPIAFFTDANCPYCKDLEGRLVDMRDSGAPVRLVWHELPLLGPSSIRHARAILAARLLNAEDKARAALSLRIMRPGPAALTNLAQEIEVDPEDFARLVNGSRVDALLSEGVALGRRLGIPGTPGTVVGRTLVIGAIKDADLRKLIEIERSEPQTVCT